MSRELSTLQPTAQSGSKQLNTMMRRTQRSQVDAMRRLAERLVANLEQDGLKKLIQGFQEFAVDYATTLDQANESGQLSFLLRSGIERLLQEWNILSRACEQRNEPNVEDRQQSVRNYLETADRQLSGYCSRWHPPAHSSYTSLRTPVAYFEKLYRISRALFHPEIPMVSIPLSDYDAPKRWQALAHEMGHHIFWNAVTLDEFVRLQDGMRQALAEALGKKLGVIGHRTNEESVVKRLNLWNLWLEEAFADICGVLFAGPRFALSAQDLAASSVSKDQDLIGRKDDVHPSLYLRPLIALQVVREIAERSPRTDYRDKLLAWAGKGQEVTRGRIPSFEDQLSSKSARQTQRSVSGEYDLPLNLPSLSDRWLAFAPDAGQKPHPGALATLDDLASDVPIIVHALLNEPLWPDDKCLWDLVCCYAGQECRDEDRHKTIDDDLADLDQMNWDALPDIRSPIVYPNIPPTSPDANSDFGRILSHLVAIVHAAETIKPDAKAEVFWKLFAAMEIETNAGTLHSHPVEDIVSHAHNFPDPPILGRASISVTWKHYHDAFGRLIWVW